MKALNTVPFVSVENMMRLILELGVETCIEQIAEYIEADFAKWEQFDKCPRIGSHSDVGVIELMPTSDGIDYGFKYVNGHPKNMKEGLQTVTAVGLLASVYTGYPTLLTEMTILTTLRTAATSAVATKYLAPKGATTLTIIGNGAQSEFQALGLKRVCGINTVRLYDIDPEATRKCAANLTNSGLKVISCSSAEEAVIGAQIITTCTADKRNATVLSDNLVGTGIHINAIGGDSPGKTELQRDILYRADIFVEYPEQTRIEGEIQVLHEDYPVKELWQVITGQIEGRTSADTITLFDGVGFAIEDFSALRWLRDALKMSSKFVDLDMIPDPDEPQKSFILKRHYVDKVPISDVCETADIQPSQFYNWQRQTFENLSSVLSCKRVETGGKEKTLQATVARLEVDLARKDHVIAVISEEYVTLKKRLESPERPMDSP